MQIYVSVLLASFYIFVALFAQSFHDHGTGQVFKNLHFAKSEKTFSADSSILSNSDCLSCHFIHTGKSLDVHEFNFTALKTDEILLKISTYEFSFLSVIVSYTRSRGPPIILT